MAGLYRNAPEGREFVIITKDAFGEVTEIHDRMPVILKADQVEAWLDGTLSPDDIVSMDFNVSVMPCEDDEDVQLTLY
jgi:putative SOS response-associated peptidase YedK